MASTILLKRSNTAGNGAYTGELGELTIDTQARKIRIHDGVTLGGFVVANMSDINIVLDTINALGISDISGLQDALNAKISSTEKGTALGVAPLNASGKIDSAYISDALVGKVEYMGTWNATTNTPTLPATPTVKGEYYVVSTAGTFEGIEFQVKDWIISNGTAWEKVDNTDAVTSVAGKTGAVTLEASDVGLGNVNNYATANTAQATAGTATNLFMTPQGVREFVEDGTYTIDGGTF